MVTITIGNYTLTERYHVPCIIYKEENEDLGLEFTYHELEDALADILYFAYEDKLLHSTTEFKQSKQKTTARKYREILENKYPDIGFIKLNADIITGQK